MQKSELIKLITLLFESKFKKYTEVTLDSWVELLGMYPDDILKKHIYVLIYRDDDFISIGQVHEMMKNEKEIKELHLNTYTNDGKKNRFQIICEHMKLKSVDMRTAVKELGYEVKD